MSIDRPPTGKFHSLKVNVWGLRRKFSVQKSNDRIPQCKLRVLKGNDRVLRSSNWVLRGKFRVRTDNVALPDLNLICRADDYIKLAEKLD
ncbi:MAG: hypothetical protein HC769_27285 [Cyanobacteria bacterium CRU_2_1]|nr:hypothetical protein [Cyanobacteria bacterium RU_5_0]NJR62205.1 hypothetical protein [Cyanobacteria bacterium CRU_2_1]